MSKAVLDSSVVLAIIQDETYDETVLDLLPVASISAVNSAEVLTKVVEMGVTHRANLERVLGFLEDIAPFTERQAALVAHLRVPTRHAGLSLGDRACLALALELGVPVYTTDRNWLRVDVGCPIHCLR